MYDSQVRVICLITGLLVTVWTPSGLAALEDELSNEPSRGVSSELFSDDSSAEAERDDGLPDEELFWPTDLSTDLPSTDLLESTPVIDAPRSVALVSGWAAEPMTALSLEPGEIRNLVVDGIDRVAVGNPKIVDVTVLSPDELLLQAKTAGTTNLILWERGGQRSVHIDVIDERPQLIAMQVRKLLLELTAPDVRVEHEGSTLFLVGKVDQQGDLDQLDQMLSAFPQVTNLVIVRPKQPAPEPPPAPLVRLTVQVIEMSRKDVEDLGVKWSSSVKLTEPAATDLSFRDSLFRWGASLSRSSVDATLNAIVQKNRGRLLAEPKLVTASGTQATAFIGVEVPILQATTASTSSDTISTSIEFRETGVLLTMTPVVLTDYERITTTIEAEVSTIDNSTALSVPVGSQTISVPGFSVRRASTEVTTASGETIVIAGLLESEDSDVVSHVPGLGNIPVIGRFFRLPEKETTQRELVISVTPELIVDLRFSPDKTVALEQALARSEVATRPMSDPKYLYALDVQERIAGALEYPLDERAAGLSGQVTLRVHLLRDGVLDRVVVTNSSGISAFDEAALDATERGSPYHAFPPDLPQDDLWLEVPVSFTL